MPIYCSCPACNLKNSIKPDKSICDTCINGPALLYPGKTNGAACKCFNSIGSVVYTCTNYKEKTCHNCIIESECELRQYHVNRNAACNRWKEVDSRLINPVSEQLKEVSVKFNIASILNHFDLRFDIKTNLDTYTYVKCFSNEYLHLQSILDIAWNEAKREFDKRFKKDSI